MAKLCILNSTDSSRYTCTQCLKELFVVKIVRNDMHVWDHCPAAEKNEANQKPACLYCMMDEVSALFLSTEDTIKPQIPDFIFRNAGQKL